MTEENIQAFINAIAPVRAAYDNICFSYLAIKSGEQFHLAQGRLFLASTPIAMPDAHKSKNVMVGSLLLSGIASNLEEFIGLLMKGAIPIHGENILFSGNESGPKYNTYFQPFHPEGVHSQNRLNVLTISGSHITPLIRQPELDWEVMAHEQPYAGIQELAFHHKVGFISHDKVQVEIVAYQVAAISAESKIEGEKALIQINVAKGLPTEHASIGYNVRYNNEIVKRGRIASSALKWGSGEGYSIGSAELDVSESSMVHCFASYANILQNHYWILDSSKILNPRLAAYEAFDNELALLKDMIEGANSKKNSRDLEMAVSCLLWILGFSVTQIDNIPRMQSAPDLMAVSPKGNYAVIECTTGLLKEDNKLPKLHDRTLAVRKQLQIKGHQLFDVLPILITSKTLDEIKPELEQAEKHGILVITREGLDEIFTQIKFYPDADKMYDESVQEVKKAEAKFKLQEILPL